MTPGDPEPDEVKEQFLAAMGEAALQYPFGPAFFLDQLRAFVRDRCPNPREGLPAVQLHLADGGALDVCHVLAVSPTWVALAITEVERAVSAAPMRTEFVPFGMISRVTVRSGARGEHHAGFNLDYRPAVVHGDV